MDEKRKGEIALAILKMLAEKRGLMLRPDEIRRELPNMCQSTGISHAELKEFGKEIAIELVVKSFGSR